MISQLDALELALAQNPDDQALHMAVGDCAMEHEHAERRLHSLILRYPKVDAFRLGHADVIEREQPEYSKFIRAQVELAAGAPNVVCAKCGRDAKTVPGQKYCGNGNDKDNAHRYVLTPHAIELKDIEQKRWLPEAWFPGVVAIRYGESTHGVIIGRTLATAIVRRGFVEEIRIPLAKFYGVACPQCRGDSVLPDGERWQLPGSNCKSCSNTGRVIECPKCRGHGRHADHSEAECRNCGGVTGTGRCGSGRVPALGPVLAAKHPITRVTFTGEKPSNENVVSTSPFWYWDAGEELGELWRHDAVSYNLNGGPRISRWFTTEQLAIDAMSTAAVDWMNSKRSLFE